MLKFFFSTFGFQILDTLRDQGNTDEHKLVSKLTEGDEMAFELLFYRYRGKVGNFIKRSLPLYIDLEETVHEIFLRIWTHKGNIDPNKPFGPYLFRVARNIVIDKLRIKIDQLVYLSDPNFSKDMSVNDTHLKLEEKDLQNWFDLMMEKIPEKRKEIFLLNRIEGLSYKEIAKKLKISENTVDTQIRRTLQFLREEIKKISFLLLTL